MQSDEELSARLLLLENQVSEVRTQVRRKHRTGRDLATLRGLVIAVRLRHFNCTLRDISKRTAMVEVKLTATLRPSTFSAHTRPPCASTMPRTIDNPRPIPPDDVLDR